jgi:hypothetical protein
VAQEEIDKPVARHGALREGEFVEVREVYVQYRVVEADVVGFALGVPLGEFQFEHSQLARFEKDSVYGTVLEELDASLADL